MTILNQFSYPLIALGVLLVSLLLLRRLVRVPWRYVAGIEVLLAALFVIGFFVLRPGASDVSTVEEARALIGNGRPTFVEFFSNYCTGCLVARPAVDAVIEQIDGEFNILRINIHSSEGRDLRDQYEFSFTPEFVLFTPQGVEVWRAHVPPGEAELNAARKSVAAS